MELHFASRMKDYEEGIFQVLNEKKNELERQGRTFPWERRISSRSRGSSTQW